jgi:hypothetical protein
MSNTNRQTRASLACGFEPPATDARAWLPPSSNGDVGFAGDPLTTCPGYTTNLPDVFEVLRARAHWSKGQLAMFDPRPHEALLVAIEVLDNNVSQFERWKMTPSKDGGGGD